ncbi:MAG: LamB/YcsF family protein [Actinomycetia bacterium]|nr:LamB/YcsF family protein [Actinomycetes bacterium]
MYAVDINCDLGELPGEQGRLLDSKLIPLVTSVNVACGEHAGDAQTMRATISTAKENNVAIGAHPSYPDRDNFGRKPLRMSAGEIILTVRDQVEVLATIAEEQGVALQHVKPHGALYSVAAQDYEVAQAIGQAIADFDPSLIYCGMANSELERAARDLDLRFISEVFADRAYTADANLVPRDRAGAVITDTDEVISRVLHMIQDGRVTTIEGADIAIEAQTICLHGDNANALALAAHLREALVERGISLVPMNQIV